MAGPSAALQVLTLTLFGLEKGGGGGGGGTFRGFAIVFSF